MSHNVIVAPLKGLLFRALEGRPDAEAVSELLAGYAADGLLLGRTPEDILERAANFVVAELDGKIVGCVALRDFHDRLYEVRSLAVAPALWGHGLGTALIREAESRAPNNPGVRLFALTYRPNLFKRAGFRVVFKDMFPEKIWADCDKCRKKDRCDEIALLKEK